MSPIEPRQAIKTMRERLEESQTVFASRFEVKQAAISGYELGIYFPTTSVARKMAKLASDLGLEYDLGTFLPE
jgi:transcriptional regulator with XRE-family HTH domain